MLNKELYDKYKDLDQERINEEFKTACEFGELEIIKYLLTSSELNTHADIHVDDDYGLCFCSHNGFFEIVKYLLTNPELKECANIHASNDYPFRWACKLGRIEIAKYLLTSEDLKEHSNIHANNDFAFTKALQENNIETLQFLIFEMKIDKTENIKELITVFKNIIDVEKMFTLRDLNNELENELHCDNINKIKFKI